MGVPTGGPSRPFTQAKLTTSTETSPSQTIRRGSPCTSPSTALPAAKRAWWNLRLKSTLQRRYSGCFPGHHSVPVALAIPLSGRSETILAGLRTVASAERQTFKFAFLLQLVFQAAWYAPAQLVLAEVQLFQVGEFAQLRTILGTAPTVIRPGEDCPASSALRILPSSRLLQPWHELLLRSQRAVLRPQVCR